MRKNKRGQLLTSSRVLQMDFILHIQTNLTNFLSSFPPSVLHLKQWSTTSLYPIPLLSIQTHCQGLEALILKLKVLQYT